MLHSTHSIVSALVASAGALACPDAATNHASGHNRATAAATSPALSGVYALASKAAKAEAKAKADASDQKHSINIVNDDGAFGLTMKDGEIVEATIDGKPVPADRIEREGSKIRFLDEDGDEVVEFHTLPDGGFWVGEGEPAEGMFLQGGLGEQPMAFMLGEEDAEPRPMIGVTLSEVGETVADQLGLDTDDVVLIAGVNEGMPADKAGLKRSDIVVKIDGSTPATEERLREVILSKKKGDKVRLEVLRKGKPVDIVVEVDEVKPRVAFGTTTGQGGAFNWRGPDNEAMRSMLEDARRAASESAIAGRAAGQAAAADARRLAEELRAQAHDTKRMLAELKERLTAEYEKLDLRISDEDKEKMREAFERAAAALKEMDFSFEGPKMRIRRLPSGQGAEMFIAPTPPVPPTPQAPARAPRAGGRDADERLDRLEERLERLTELLEKSAEKKDR